jgi:hypothetical protein
MGWVASDMMMASFFVKILTFFATQVEKKERKKKKAFLAMGARISKIKNVPP